MAKQSFKIPASLDVSYFDMEFNLKTKNGLGAPKPVTAKTLFSGMLAIFGWFYLVFQTFVGKGGIGLTILFSVLWLLFAILVVRPDKTRRMGLELAFSLINYIPKHGRFVPVRMSDDVLPLQRLFNIKTIDEEDGLVHFLDKRIGHVYHVVGSASSLMFEADKQLILNKVDSFYRNLPVEVEVIYDTVYEGHSVDEQVANIERDRADLVSTSPGLHRLLNEQQNVLEKAINNNKGLTSLHQYLVVRAPSEGTLREFENLLIGDVESEGLMFRLAKTLGYEEATRYFKSLISEA